jgi:hypothetical protein
MSNSTDPYSPAADQGEIYEQAKDLSRRQLYALWQRLGIARERA